MRWTWKLGKVGGIQIQVHATFLLLVAWVAWVYYNLEPSLASVVDGVVFLLVVFGIVVLHELSHAFAARLFGIGTVDITLLPVGGVSRLERQPERPHQELIVALAGPASNLVLAALFLGIIVLRADPPAAAEVFTGRSPSLLADLFWVNVALAVFNLLPAFPMDGGRALRALLAMLTDRRRATKVAAFVGKALAVAFVGAGLLLNPFLAVIGVLVWLGASAEAVSADLEQTMHGLTVAEAMVEHAQTVRPEDPLARPVQLMLSGFQRDFPAVDGTGRLVGMLPFEALLRGIVEQGQGAPVHAVMQTGGPVAHPQDDLFEAAAQLSRRDRRLLPVLREDGVLVGLLTLENISELLRVHAALNARPGALRVTSPDREPEPRALAGGPRHG